MSLNSFFDTLDTEAQFDAWKSTIKQKLIHLKNIIPIASRAELHYIGETLEFLDSVNIVSTEYLAHKSGVENKTHLKERLKVCNSYYKKFGKR